MKLGIMIYPTMGEAEQSFHNILLFGKGIKQFNKHERWFLSEIDCKIVLRSASCIKYILSNEFDTVWVDERVDVHVPIKAYGYNSLKQILESRAKPDCVFGRGESRVAKL